MQERDVLPEKKNE